MAIGRMVSSVSKSDWSGLVSAEAAEKAAKRAAKMDEISREQRASQILHARQSERGIARLTPLYRDASGDRWRARAVLSYPRDSWTRPEVSEETHAFPLLGDKPINGCWETCCGSLVYGRRRPGPLRAWITCDVCISGMETTEEGCDER